MPRRITSLGVPPWRSHARLRTSRSSTVRRKLRHCGPPGEGACLRCFNQPEDPLPDGMLASELGALDDRELEALAADHGARVAVLRKWRDDPGCATIDSRVLHELHDRFGGAGPEFAGGVRVRNGRCDARGGSCAGGHRPGPDPRERWKSCRAPAASRVRGSERETRPYLRDPSCPRCDSDAPGLTIWRQRVACRP